ncbi:MULTISPECIES: alkene reductase [Streptosporangium]|uniref:N-ethylmaleimide reductase n=1 Tax=Streptosporangium brasiliense TaxID=47480 RepID=A0ABT9RI76_9ACTN|nr:alkene reductase [Streptosporangium brasiliense]MDP9868993.1 N-ethylmaleimide reductase [Streptosporangium brasiliense]
MAKTLFDTVTVGKLDLPNRLAMAPMTRSRAAAGGLATELTAEYYAQRAGAGLIITEGVQPSVIGQGSIDTPGLHNAEQVKAWRRVTDAVHDRDGRIFAQLWHSGRVAHPSLYPDGRLPVAPSAVPSGGQMTARDGTMLDHPTPHALTVAEIAQTIADFAQAARNAIDAGFDVVELHGANGYLIQQFLSDNVNLRTDEYGDKIRFAVEVAHAVTEAIGPERTAIRLSPGNPYNNIEESDPMGVYTRLVRALHPDLAYVHLLEVGNRRVTEEVRAAWPGVLMLNPHSGTTPVYAGMHASPEAAEEALTVADVISLGALWLANPDLPERVRRGGPYNEPDRATFYGGDHEGCTDYPALS